MKTDRLIRRVKRLDELYLAADSATRISLIAPRKADRAKWQKIAKRKWAAYRRLVKRGAA